MSVIFKTLKKLKTESVEKKNSKNKWVHRKRIYFFQNALYSPSYILLLFFILTVIGSGTLYGYYHLCETGGKNAKDVAVAKTEILQQAGVATSERTEINGSKSLNLKKSPNSSRFEYLPPRANDKSVEVYTSNKQDNIDIQSVTDKKRSPKSRGTIEKNTAAKVKTENSAELKTEEVSPGPEVEKIFLANAKKNAKIARLVAGLRWEMAHGKDKQTETLLDELAALKGQDNSYFLKLKAVWHIQNKEFERAEDLLKIVLTKNEVDQEAGINMAIIEIKTQHMQKAYERLKKLRAIYPENIRIAEILQNMRPFLNKTHIRRLTRDNKS